MSGIAALISRVNLRYLFTRRLRSLLTVLGVAGGVTLVMAISVINGTLVASIDDTATALAGRADLEVAAGTAEGLSVELVDRIAALEGVEEVVPTLRVTTTAEGPGGRIRLLVLGVTPRFSSLFPDGDAGLRLEGGFGLTGEGIVLSGVAAEAAGVEVGDDVEVSTPAGARRLPVAGIATGSVVSTLNGGSLGVMVLPRAQATFARTGTVDSIYVVAEDDALVDELRGALEAVTSGAAMVGTPGTRTAAYEETFKGITTLSSLAGTVALFVSGFVVYNAMSMSFTERRKEISLALAMGAARKQMFGGFLVEALIVGGAGTVIGLGGGLALAKVLLGPAVEAYRLLPITSGGDILIRPQSVALGVAAGIAVSIAGAFLPARRVLRLPLIESLRPDAPYAWTGSRESRARIAATVALGLAAVGIGVGGMVVYILVLKETWVANLAVGITLVGLTMLLPRGVALVGVALKPLYRRIFGPHGRLAYDSLERNRGRTSLTVGALMLTLGLVIATGSALASFQSEIRMRAAGWFGAEIYVNPTSYSGIGADQPVPVSFARVLKEVEGVKAVYPGRYAFATLQGELALVYALPSEIALEEGATDLFSDQGRSVDRDAYLDALRSGGVIVSRFTADRLELEPGDEVTLPTPTGERSFEVGGTFDDLNTYHSMYMELSVYQDAWDDDKADRFGVLTAPGSDDEEVIQGLERVVARAGIDAEVQTKDEVIDDILVLVAGIFSIARAIQLAALIVAALTIANTMFTAVHERKWEMGLQRAVGLDERGLGKMVLLEAVAIGILGVLGAVVMGAALGFLMVQSMRVQYTWVIPFALPWGLVTAAGAGGVLLAATAGLLPSRLAKRIPIIEALRYE